MFENAKVYLTYHAKLAVHKGEEITEESLRHMAEVLRPVCVYSRSSTVGSCEVPRWTGLRIVAKRG